MPPRKTIFQIIVVLCAIMALMGALLYPLNTMHIFWIILYEATVISGTIGIIVLIYHRGFDDKD